MHGQVGSQYLLARAGHAAVFNVIEETYALSGTRKRLQLALGQRKSFGDRARAEFDIAYVSVNVCHYRLIEFARAQLATGGDAVERLAHIRAQHIGQLVDGIRRFAFVFHIQGYAATV